jgi:hypothetical protein
MLSKKTLLEKHYELFGYIPSNFAGLKKSDLLEKINKKLRASRSVAPPPPPVVVNVNVTNNNDYSVPRRRSRPVSSDDDDDEPPSKRSRRDN